MFFSLLLAQTEILLEHLDLSSITGIVIITLFIVELLKRLLRNVVFFSKIPVWTYAIAIACVQVFIANRLLQTEDGVPLLPGNLTKLLWATVVAAASASGFYSWLRAGQTNLKESAMLMTRKTAVILLPFLLMVGCSTSPQHIVYRETAHRYTNTAFKDLSSWTNLLESTPENPNGQKDKLPTLSANDAKQIRMNVSEYNQLYEADKAEDRVGPFQFLFDLFETKNQ
jgi:hypothetical protein